MRAIEPIEHETSRCYRSTMTPRQIIAARALLGMERIELAKLADLSVGGLQRIELDNADPRASTLRKIQTALEECGIEFIGTTGVKLRESK